MSKFYTRYNKPPCKFEVNSGLRLVDLTGYIPLEKQVKAMMSAGMRLDSFRSAQFDSEDENGDIPLDPTRKPGYDLADASMALKELKAKVPGGGIKLKRKGTDVPKVPEKPASMADLQKKAPEGEPKPVTPS